MIHKYFVLTSNNTKQYIFVSKIFSLDLMINKPFYNLRPEILSIMTRQEKMFEGFNSPHIPIHHTLPFPTGNSRDKSSPSDPGLGLFEAVLSPG